MSIILPRVHNVWRETRIDNLIRGLLCANNTIDGLLIEFRSRLTDILGGFRIRIIADRLVSVLDQKSSE